VPSDGVYAHGLTPLMWAAGYGRIQVATLLIFRGAAIDLADDRGRTALMMAAANGQPAMVALLRHAGADPARTDAEGKTAADLARAANGCPALTALGETC